MSRLKMWDEHKSWDEGEKAWDAGAKEAASRSPNRSLKRLPKMVGVTKKTAQWLRWKAFSWMMFRNQGWKLLRFVARHPLRYVKNYSRSLLKKEPYRRMGDFFLYGLKDLSSFDRALTEQDTLLVVGFSYCHKPFECPSGRFTAQCVHDPLHDVCRQCFIGKALHALPSNGVIPLVIPTIHYIGQKIFEILEAHPKKRLIFLITACEMTLKMFADWGNLAGVEGVGVRLDGRICNTMEAFSLSERGIKPGLTVVLDETQKQFLKWIRTRSDAFS